MKTVLLENYPGPLPGSSLLPGLHQGACQAAGCVSRLLQADLFCISTSDSSPSSTQPLSHSGMELRHNAVTFQLRVNFFSIPVFLKSSLVTTSFRHHSRASPSRRNALTSIQKERSHLRSHLCILRSPMWYFQWCLILDRIPCLSHLQ